MKVVIDSLPHDRGGGITYLKNILPQLCDSGDEYYVLVPDGRDALERYDEENINLVTVRFPVGNLFLRLFYQQFILPIVLLFMNTDVLYSPGDITTFLAPCTTVVAIRNPNPYFDTPSHTLMERVRYRLQRSLSRLSAVRSKAVIFVSEYSKDQIINNIKIDEKKCHVVYHGIDVEKFQNPIIPQNEELHAEIERSSPFVLCVSTLYRHKNYEALIKGYSKLSSDLREDYPLLIAGGSPDQDYYDSIVDLAHSEGIRDDVTFLGRVEYKYIPYLYSNTAVSILPSRLETFGHTLVESMAAGVPIVAANSACIPEITDGAALLFEPEDHEELSEKIKMVLTDEEVSQSLKMKGSNRVRDFSWSKAAEETSKVLQSATG